MSKVLRPDKNGGMSMCSSREDRVGMGRCTHTLDNSKPPVPVTYVKETRSYNVDVHVAEVTGSQKSEEEKVKEISGYLNKTRNSLPRDKKQEIIKKIRG